MADRARLVEAQDKAEEVAGLPNRIVEAIHNGILSGRYVPGQKLIENELTKSFKVSRSSVREALKQLEADGVVRISRNRGAYIRSLTWQETMDLFEILMVITPFLVRLAAEAIAAHRKPISIAAANQLLANLESHNGGSLEYLDLRRQFYDTMIAITGNSQIKSIVPVMLICLLRLQFQPFMALDRERSIEMDREIVRAVLAEEGATAERLTKRYLKRMRERFGNLPDEAFASED